MTQQTIEPGTRRTISGTVLNPRDDGHGHYLIDLKGTGWTQDQYAVTAFQVAGEKTLAGLPAGREITVIVEAQHTRTGKDGSLERDWYWKVIGSSNGAAPATAAPHDAAYETRKVAALTHDPARDSIERQVLAKESRLVVEWLLSQPPEQLDDLRERYMEEFARTFQRLREIFYREPTTEIHGEDNPGGDDWVLDLDRSKG